MKGWPILILLGIFTCFSVLGIAQSVEKGITVTVTVPSAVVPPRGGGVVYPPSANVIFEGRAYPKAFLTLLKDNKVTTTFFAESSGLFKKELTGLTGGTYNFSIFAEDTEGRKSVTLSFTIGILDGTTTTISRIFIPPTISLFPVQVEKGRKIDISGQAFPKSRVEIFISPEEIVKETLADSKGKWLFGLETSLLKEGEYSVRAKALFGEGEQSQFSQTISFLISPPKCRGADLNFDGKVNIVDFSILMYFWHSTLPENICADINRDGIVNLVDFSIMMYWWSG